MSFTVEQARARLHALGRGRTEIVLEAAAEGEPDLIHGTLVLAIGLRESSIRNICGDHGHGRGWLQIDDRFHQSWLRSHPGCKDATWGPFVHSVKDGGALPAGRVPGMLAAEQYAILLLRGNAAFGVRSGVRKDHAKQFMVAGYNCGAGNALRAYRTHGIGGVDRFTAGGDYSADVLANQRAVREALASLGW
jgi:hypothetical protein